MEQFCFSLNLFLGEVERSQIEEQNSKRQWLYTLEYHYNIEYVK